MTKKTPLDDSDIGNIIVIVLTILFVIYCPNIFRYVVGAGKSTPNEMPDRDRR